MSVKASWFQIGLSNTANLNFHWRNLLDGLLRLTRGNAAAPIADVMLVNADNSVSFPGNVASGVLGTGQTWKTVSRTSGVTYTNTTGKPIMITFNVSANVSLSVNIGGVVIINVTTGAYDSSTHQYIIPAGMTYLITGITNNQAELS